VSKYEEPKYKVLKSQSQCEIRQYESKVIAETIISGERDRAINYGFSIIADYIFGNNTSTVNAATNSLDLRSQPSEKIAMTAPVLQQQVGQEIAMTVPVLQAGDQTAWSVQFVMPSQYTLATLPKPNNPRITIKEIPSSTIGTICFSGSAGEETLRKKEAELRAYLHDLGVEIMGTVTYAFYNSAFTVPMFRRNEVMLELKEKEW
jgi:hypothetical protein